MTFFPSRFRDIKRLRFITAKLMRLGFGDVVFRLKRRPFVARLARVFFFNRGGAAQYAKDLSTEQRIRILFEELGPTFVKFGQVLATRPDLVPMSLILELRKLHDEVPPFPFEKVVEIIESGLGKKTAEVFAEISPEPIAAASIAQVHRARLLDGSDVVVKVQRPDIREVIASDLNLLRGLADMLEERVPEIRRFKPSRLVEEFSKSIRREIDFRIELENLQRFKANFAGDTDICIPGAYPQFSTPHLLVMEYVSGAKITDRMRLLELGIDLHKLARTGMTAALRSIFEHGFFHADPHPGNFFIKDDGTFALLDFGMMGTVQQERIDDMLTFMVSLLTNDIDMLVNLFLDLDIIGDDTDLRALRSEVSEVLGRYKAIPLKQIDIGRFLEDIIEIVVRNNVQLPADLLLIGKALATMEGITKELYPDFNPLEEVQPYLIAVYLKRNLDPYRHSRNITKNLYDMMLLLKDAPADLKRILRKARKGELRLKTAEENLEWKAKRAASETNKKIYAFLSIAFLFAAIYSHSHATLLMNMTALFCGFMSVVFGSALLVSIFGGKERLR